MKPIIYQVRFYLVAYFVFLVSAIVILFTKGQDGSFLLINGAYTKASDQFFKYFTYVGNGAIYGVLILVYLFIDSRRSLMVTLTLIFTTLVAQLIKHFVYPHALRPKAFFNTNLLHFVIGVDVHSYGSFPSGHAVSAFSIGLLLTYFTKNKHMGIVYLILAALVGYSRIYLAQHFLLDVIIGSLIGVIVTLLCMYVVATNRFPRIKFIVKLKENSIKKSSPWTNSNK